MIDIRFNNNGTFESALYPVGSFYFSLINTSPASTVGGTWVKVQNMAIRGLDDDTHVPSGKKISDNTYSSYFTIGNDTHTLSKDEMPSHTHTFTGSAVTSGTPSNNTSGTPSNNATNSTGSHSHNAWWVLTWGRDWDNHKWYDYSCASPSSNSMNVQVTIDDAGAHTHTLSNHTHSLQSHTHSVTAKGTNSSTGGGGRTVLCKNPSTVLFGTEQRSNKAQCSSWGGVAA